MSFILSILAFALIPISLVIGTVVYKKYPKIKQDNVIEELLEEGIKKETGVDIDLSPNTPEDKD